VTETLDTTTLVVMANRLESITREMTNTVVRAARSTTMAARDFSCCIVSAQHEVLSVAEGVPAHVFGMGPSAASMAARHPELREGDAFLHNDPYMGNSHAADHQILVPVFVEGEHRFTACVKAHQVDCGNSLPTTYMATARDVYEEGALIFPCVRVQEDYVDVDDIIGMCERRIRGFDIWYGDYLAQVGAARLAERRLKELCARFGVDKVTQFTAQWLDYSERITADAIRSLPSGHVTGHTALDPFPGLPDGIPLKVELDIDAENGRVVVDLRDNPDCVPTGLNLTETTARNAGVSGVFTVLNSRGDERTAKVPYNAGSFRRIEVLLRENCVVGIPRHPASCSVATNTVADRVVGMIITAFADLGGDAGLAEPCYGSGPLMAVISGHDPQRDGYYIMQIISGTAGGPGSAASDGWPMLLLAGAGGVIYMDSAEVVEQKNPVVIWDKSVRVDSEGPGRRRGAPGNVCIYGPRFAPMEAHWFLDGVVNPPRGVRGGGAALGPTAFRADVEGNWTEMPDVIGEVSVDAGETVISLSAGGGGYGDPFERDPERVLEDVVEGWISAERAEAVYGVVLEGDPDRVETLRIAVAATAARRAAGAPPEAVEGGYRRETEQRGWWAKRPSNVVTASGAGS
jgi:N-methylhydantoinase B